MRPRHVVILALLAAVPLGLAIALTGGGSTPVPGGALLARVSLKLLGGSDAGVLTACRKTHSYEAYSSQATVRFRGTISPPGPWSISIKLKACYGGAFQSAGDIPAAVTAHGTYSGSFPAPIGGYYNARADVREAGALVTHSLKRYFAIR